MSWKLVKLILIRKLKNIRFPFITKSTIPKQLIIFTRGRSGSNFLLSILESHPLIRNCGEIFGTSQKKKYLDQIKKTGAKNWYFKKISRRSFEKIICSKFFYRFFENAYGRNSGITDLKELYDYLQNNKNILVIHLFRKNKFAQLVSLKLAQKTNQYTIYNKRKRYNDVKLRITIKECEDEFIYLDKMEQHFLDEFKHHKNLVVYFEDLIGNTEEECRKIFKFLNFKKYYFKASTVKQNIQHVSEVIENYKELKSHFSDTKYKKFFGD